MGRMKGLPSNQWIHRFLRKILLRSSIFQANSLVLAFRPVLEDIKTRIFIQKCQVFQVCLYFLLYKFSEASKKTFTHHWPQTLLWKNRIFGVFGWCDIFCMPSGRQSYSQSGHQAGQPGDWSQGKLLPELRKKQLGEKNTVYVANLQSICLDTFDLTRYMLISEACVVVWN